MFCCFLKKSATLGGASEIKDRSLAWYAFKLVSPATVAFAVLKFVLSFDSLAGLTCLRRPLAGFAGFEGIDLVSALVGTPHRHHIEHLTPALWNRGE